MQSTRLQRDGQRIADGDGDAIFALHGDMEYMPFWFMPVVHCPQLVLLENSVRMAKYVREGKEESVGENNSTRLVNVDEWLQSISNQCTVMSSTESAEWFANNTDVLPLTEDSDDLTIFQRRGVDGCDVFCLNTVYENSSEQMIFSSQAHFKAVMQQRAGSRRT